MAAAAGSANAVAPISSPLLMWKSPRMMVGIRPRKSPYEHPGPDL
jgi:hypothetical protein